MIGKKGKQNKLLLVAALGAGAYLLYTDGVFGSGSSVSPPLADPTLPPTGGDGRLTPGTSTVPVIRTANDPGTGPVVTRPMLPTTGRPSAGVKTPPASTPTPTPKLPTTLKPRNAAL